MPKAKRFEDLEVWQSSRKLTNLVYDFSEQGSFARDFGLRDQMRRAAVSVMSNIAEGFESMSNKSFIKYLGYAKASAGELRAQLYIALDRKHILETQFNTAQQVAESCSRQLAGFIKYLQTHPHSVREDSVIYEA